MDTRAFKQSLDHLVKVLVEHGVKPYDAYLRAYEVADCVKNASLRAGIDCWREYWKISLYYNTKAGYFT